MAKFTLSALTPSGEVVLTYFDAKLGQIGGYTFDEVLNTSTDTSSLTFSALKYHVEGETKTINLPIMALTYGSIVRLRERDKMLDFKVQSINYTFTTDNLQLEFTCLDRFQAEASKIAIGYTIQSDTSDPNFLGAQSIDTWAHKIIQDTNLPWGYINIDEANETIIKQLAAEETLHIRDDITDTEAWEEIAEPIINEFESNPATLNNKVSFECSNSNAFAALKDLASQNELILRVSYETQNIYFIPQKNWWFKGYYFNPHINLQQMGLQGDGQNMTTVLNVTGGKDINEQEITLVPSIPESFESFVKNNPEEWSNSYYYPGFFNDHSNNDILFSTLASCVPWFENKLIDTSFYVDKLITAQDQENIENILNNDLRKVNVPLVLATRAHLKNIEKWVMQINEERIRMEMAIGDYTSVLDTIAADIKKGMSQTNPVLIVVQDMSTNKFFAISQMNSTIKVDGTIVGRFIVDVCELTFNTSINTHIIEAVHGSNSTSVTINLSDQTGYYILPAYTSSIINGSSIPELDTFLNDETSKLDAAWQTLLKNIYLLREYWEGNDFKRCIFYCNFKKMGVRATSSDVRDITVQEELTTNSYWNAIDDNTLSQTDLDQLSTYFNGTLPTRTEVIEECARIATQMTQYWNAMRTAGLQQGLYFPLDWDCTDLLEQQLTNVEKYYFLAYALLPLRRVGIHRYRLNYLYGGQSGSRTQIIQTQKSDILQLRYFDRQRDAFSPLITNDVHYLHQNPNQVISSNTQNYYELVQNIDVDSQISDRFWYSGLQIRPAAIKDTVQLYKTKLKYQDTYYSSTQFSFIPAGGPFNRAWNETTSERVLYTQKFLYSLLSCATEGTSIYSLQTKHDAIWHDLYVTYPGIFAESTYENTDAATSMDLYFAAKAQMETLNKPEFSYNLTGIDIYTKDEIPLLWDIALGDQVRIDYIEAEGSNQVIDDALQTQLFVTGINHSLRDDSNYQFTIATRKATDTMVRRFAQLLTLGR